MGDIFKIYFVKSDKYGENVSSMAEAFELLRKGEQDVQVEWLSQEDCMSFELTGKPRHKIFIFDTFGGPAFDQIQNLGCRIYGPQCLISNLQHGMDLPKDMKHPIFSLAMKGVKVCCTAVDKSVRNEIQRLVPLMSGKMARDLTADCTHVIAGEVGSQKYMVSQAKGKLVMTKEWVFKVWESSQSRHVLATDEMFLKYKCPIFYGLMICVSGFNQPERNKMKDLVTKGGGRYSGDLKMNECTHLILKEPKGAKYEAARSWKIKTVTDRWLFDCIDNGKYLDPKAYQFDKSDKEMKTSTPERMSIAGPNISNVSAISTDARESTFQLVNETDMLSSRMSMQLNATGRTLEETVQKLTCGDMDTSVNPVDIFLDGCRVYLSGVESSMQEKLKKIITAGGGFRTMDLENGVTHVIVGKQVQSDLVAVNKLTERPFMIRSDWLMDCYHKNCHLDEKDYLVNISDIEGQQESVSNSKSFKEPDEISQKKSEASMLNMEEAPSDLQMAALLSQYTAQGNEPHANDQTVCRKEVEADEEKNESFKVDAPPPQDEMTQDPNDLTDDWPSDQYGIFNNKVFVFLGLADELQEELALNVEAKGGRVINLNHTRQIADIAIVPLNGYTVNVTVPDVLTVVWLEMCLESDSLIPVNHWLARPLEIPEQVPLQGCCLSVSGFPSTERSSIVYILESLGAICENHFARRTTKTARACTHLICNSPEGSKFNAAKKWGIPAVGKEWLIACLTSGKKPPEEEFDIEFICQKNEDNEEDDNDQTKAPALDSSLKSNLGEPPANSLTANKESDAPEAPLTNDGDLPKLGNRTDLTEKSMSVTLCLEEPLEKVPSSSKENSQCSSETDLNPLREVNRCLKTSDAIATRFSPKTSHDEKGKAMNENESVCPGIQKTPGNPRIRELAVQDANTSASSSTPLGLIKGGGETPGTFMQPGYRAKFDFTGMFSPCTPDEERDLNKSTPLIEVFSRQIAKAARNTAKLKKEPTPCQSQHEYVGPLYGVVIAVAKKLGRNHVEYNNLVVELGGDYTWQYNDSATHFIFQGRPNDTNKEFRKAREDGKFIVSPHWLQMCKEQKCRVDESLFPHHFNPSQALTLLTDKETPLRSKRMKTRSKGETPIKAGIGRTPARKLPMLEIQVPSSKIPSPKMNLEKRLTTVDENVNNPCDEITKYDGLRNEERAETESVEKGSSVDVPIVERKKEDTDSVSNRASTTRDEEIKDKEKEALSKTLETVLAEASSRSRKSSRKKGKRINLGGQRNSSNGNTPESTLTRSGATTWSAKEPTKDSNSLPEPSQSVQVMWDDPTERLEKEKLAHRLERVCDPSQNTDDYLAAMDFPQPGAVTVEDQNDHQSNSKTNKETYRSPTPEAPSIAFPVARPASTVMSPQPVELLSEESSDSRMSNFGNPLKKIPAIMVSGMKDQERFDYGALVEELGGKMVDKQHFDTTCTHLVVTQPIRNEKYLSSVAAGNWVLHKSYFEACRKEGKLVREENHEWGSDYTLPLMQNMTGQTFKLAAAAHKWRKKVSSMKKSNPACRGAFHGWTVMLCLDRHKEQNFQRLLEAGGATVQILRPPFPQNVKASHAFLDLHKVTVPQEDLETLIGLKIDCLKAEYIAAYLTDDPIPDPSDYCPPEVLALKACLPNEKRSRKRKATYDDDDESTSNHAR